MKLVIAPDKYKNSLSGLQFCNAVEEGLRNSPLNPEVLKLPLADGGDGTLEVIDFYLNGRLVKLEVNNPFFKPIMASYLYAEDTKTAFIEMAEASGVKLLRSDELDCKNATTFGTGEMIADALKKGAKTIILGIGGSATNDCGIGMAAALGYRFLGLDGKELKPIGANLSEIMTIDDSRVLPKLMNIKFKVACDVSNPLYGKQGAAYVYAAQKGATHEDIRMLDSGMRHFSKIIETDFGINPQNLKGGGAAGGMGMASKVFLRADLKPGIKLVKALCDFDSKITGADWIITGEGRLDSQTLSGKTIEGVVSSAKAKGIKVAAFCGVIDLSEKQIKDFGIDYADAVLNYTEKLNDALKNSYGYVKKMAQVFVEKIGSYQEK